jgi:hypothetical protein
MEDIFESLKTFVLTDEDLARSDETKRKIAEAQARRHAIRKALNNG